MRQSLTGELKWISAYYHQELFYSCPTSQSRPVSHCFQKVVWKVLLSVTIFILQTEESFKITTNIQLDQLKRHIMTNSLMHVGGAGANVPLWEHDAEALPTIL